MEKKCIIDMELWNDLKAICGIDPNEEIIRLVENAKANGETVYVTWDVIEAWKK